MQNHHFSWTADATSVLERACERHGGWERWNRLRRIRLFPTLLRGLLPGMKGYGRTFHLPEHFEIEPHGRRTKFDGFPDDAHVGIFENGAVRIEDRQGARVIESSADHRRTFRGFAKNRRWTPLDALYFFGYALWHYHSLPFSLRDARLVACRAGRYGGAALHVLDVELDGSVPTHCRKQSFYFDDTFRLVRHDYVADIVGVWARGAHFWMHYRDVQGVPVAMERVVLPRLGRATVPVTVLGATFERAEVESEGV